MLFANFAISTVVALLLQLSVFVLGEPASKFYNDLDCVKVTGDGKQTKYDCSVLDKISEDKCFYNGKEYAIDETIEEGVIKDKCIVECTCIQIYTTNKARWSCVDIECPELFRRLEPDCKLLYDNHENCCSTRKICGDEQAAGTCEYGGKTYVYGEKFYPNEEKCKWCICGEGFNGSLTEPWCHTFSCNLYLHYLNYIRDGCLPTYYESDSCCPIPVWRCPTDGDSVITPKTVEVDENNKDYLCKFGNLTMSIGQMLSKSTESSSKCVECTCQVPPYPTCVMNKQCEREDRNSYNP